MREGDLSAHFDIQYLPDGAAEIAVRYAKELSAPAVEKPLKEFLQDASTIQGLEGVALALWREPKAFTFISVYALTNGEFCGVSTASISRIYAPFHEAAHSVDRLLSSELYFVNTRHRDAQRTVAQLGKELASESFHSLVTLALPKIA